MKMKPVEILKYVRGKGAKLVAVSKRKPIVDIKKAVADGVRIIGENRVQEAKEKYIQLEAFLNSNRVEVHFIGHVQSNKAKDVVRLSDLIHTLDSIKLARRLDDAAKNSGKKQRVLIQINIGKEPQKSGIAPEKIERFLEDLKIYTSLSVEGFMCIAPRVSIPEDARPYFRSMKSLFDQNKTKYGLKHLSMGMSATYKQAIDEGATLVRIGTAIFGKRK